MFYSFIDSEIADNPYITSVPGNAFHGLSNESLTLWVSLLIISITFTEHFIQLQFFIQCTDVSVVQTPLSLM